MQILELDYSRLLVFLDFIVFLFSKFHLSTIIFVGLHSNILVI